MNNYNRLGEKYVTYGRILHCPHCGHTIDPVAIAKHIRGETTDAQREASRLNGSRPVKPGSKPRGRPTQTPRIDGEKRKSK